MPRSEVPVDALCAEAGRWTGTRQGQAKDQRFVGTSAVAALSVRGSAQCSNSQTAVWHNVDFVNARARNAPTGCTVIDTIEVTDVEVIECRV